MNATKTNAAPDAIGTDAAIQTRAFADPRHDCPETSPTACHLMSEHVARQLNDAQLNIDRFLAAQVDRGQLHSLAPGERIKARLRKLAQQLSQTDGRSIGEHARGRHHADADHVMLAESIVLETLSLRSSDSNPLPTLQSIAELLAHIEANTSPIEMK